MPKADFIYSDPSLPGSIVGNTPYGTYDKDVAFVSESIQVCKFVSRKLGHPVMQVEFGSGSIYAMYEEAVSEYSTQINHYNMKNWLWESYGTEDRVSGSGYGSDGSSSVMGTGSFQPQSAHMGTTFLLSEQYGEAVNLGGGLTLYSSSITLAEDVQVYNLQTAVQADHTSSRIEIQRVFNQGPAAITRFYDPFAGSFEQRQMLDAFGFGNVAPAVSFVMRPISYDIARAQAIETNDLIRKSAYSFEIVNNEIRIFPRPRNAGDKVYFQYYLKSDKGSTTRTWTKNKVSDPSNIPYKFLTYSEINAAGRQWIRKYTAALSKELLGIIRSKYASLPLPNGEVSMDGEGLKAEGREEKSQLLDDLKEFLESVSLQERSRVEQETADAQQQVLNKAPLKIYIG